MQIVALDLEGVLVPEIRIASSEPTGIPGLRRTTRDEPVFVRRHGLGLGEDPDAMGPAPSDAI